jgi:hypothetical protein
MAMVADDMRFDEGLLLWMYLDHHQAV